MPLHDDEMNRRREKREAQRKKQQAEAKRIRLTLVVAALVLVLCGVGIYRLIQNNRSQEPAQMQQAEVPVETTKATEPTRPTQPDPITTVHIKAAGDLNVTDQVILAGLSAVGYDYSRAFKDVAAVLSDADLTVMNFEGNISGDNYGSATTAAPMELLQGLRNAGVDLLQVANSCIINNGMIGLTSTLQGIRNAGIEPIGAFATANELRESKGYTITEVRGVKVAFVAFTKGLGGRGMPAGNEDMVNLLYKDYATTYQEIDRERIDRILKNVETEKPDITIALLHWGSEYNDDISKTQNSIVSLMKKRGVDVILGTHPHTLQPIAFDQAEGTLVAYSLGDFFGDADRGATNYSIILDIEITKDSSTGITKVTDYSYTPIYTVTEGECDGYRRVVRIEKAIEAWSGNYLDKVTDACKDSMLYALQRIEERMAVPTEVTCPECEKELEVLANSKSGTLVTNANCKCGNVLLEGSDVSDYD